MADCFDQIRKELGEEVTDEQIKSVIESLERIKNDKDFLGKAKNLKKRSEEEIAFLAHTKSQEVIALRDNKEFLLKVMDKAENPNDYFVARLSGLDRAVEGGNLSIPQLQESTHRRLLNTFVHAVGGRKNFLELTSGEWDREALHVIDALNKGQSISKFSAEAQALGKAAHITKKKSVQDLEASGNLIKERDDHLIRQTHDADKIFDEGRESWKEKIAIRLDHEKTFGPGTSTKEKNKILDTIYDDITAGTPVNIGFIGGRRSLHFASPDDFFEYNSEFGKGNLMEVMNASMISSARRSAVTRVLGPNPLRTLKSIEKDIVNSLSPEQARKFMQTGRGGQKGQRDALIATVLRTNEHPGRNLLAKTTSALLQLNSLSKLGGAFPTTFTDIGLSVEMFKSVAGVPRMQGAVDSVKSFFSVLKPEDLKTWSAVLDMNFDDMVLENYDRFGMNEPGYSSVFRDAGRAIMKSTLIPAQSARAKVSAARFLSINLARNSKKSFNELNENLVENFKRFEIGEKEWNIFTRAKQEINGVEAITPEAIRDLEGLTNKQKTDLENKLALYLADNAKIGSPDVTVRERAFITNGLDIGTVEGAAARLIGQFKSFTFSMPRVHRRILLSNPDIDATSLRQAIRTRAGLQQIGALMAETTVLAAAGLFVKDLIKGKTPRDVDAEFVAEAFSNAALPMAGVTMLDMFRGEFDSKYRSVLKDLAGPTFGQVEDFGDLAAQLGKAEGKKAMSRAAKIVLQNTPGQNLWYIAPLVNKAFLSEFHELMNPGYINRMKQRTRKKGQNYWFEPF